MTSLSPGALAWTQDRTIVRYPDAAIETTEIKPKRAGVDVRLVALAWKPMTP